MSWSVKDGTRGGSMQIVLLCIKTAFKLFYGNGICSGLSN
jgi:hypothetical protein